jgi:PPM family protein phosphatase
VAALPDVIGRLVLVTDGVHRELSAHEIAAVLAHAPDAAIAARELTDLALLAGGGDNASATVVEVPLVPALAAQHSDTGPTFPAVAARESA